MRVSLQGKESKARRFGSWRERTITTRLAYLEAAASTPQLQGTHRALEILTSPQSVPPAAVKAAHLSWPVTRSTSVRSSTPLTRPTCGVRGVDQGRLIVQRGMLGMNGGHQAVAMGIILAHMCAAVLHTLMLHASISTPMPRHPLTCRKSAPAPAPSSVPSLPAAGESSSITLSGVAPTAWEGEESSRRRVKPTTVRQYPSSPEAHCTPARKEEPSLHCPHPILSHPQCTNRP